RAPRPARDRCRAPRRSRPRSSRPESREPSSTPPALQDSPAGETALRFLRLETVRRIPAVQEDLDLSEPGDGFPTRVGQTDPGHVLDAVNRTRLGLAIERVLGGLAREVEFVPLEIRVAGSVMRRDRAAIAPAPEVIPGLYHGCGRPGHVEIDGPGSTGA